MLAKRLRRQCGFRLVKSQVSSSARRWQQHGILRTAAINRIVLIGARLGVPYDWLVRLYDRDRSGTRQAGILHPDRTT